MKEKGQIILILLLVLTVALGIGISIIQRSLTDVSTSTAAEQSSRAFSAAEAGIERALKDNTDTVNFADTNSSATVSQTVSLPELNQALEYPPVGKEEIAHFWLANPNTALSCTSAPPAPSYTQPSIDIYWGSPGQPDKDKAAIEINVILRSVGACTSQKLFYDPVGTSSTQRDGRDKNGFDDPGVCSDYTITTSSGPNRHFFCKKTLTFGAGNPLIIRARLLYTNVSQPIALQPLNGCGDNCSLPKQAKIYTSTGVSGTTTRTIQLFTLEKVVPFYFDYAIFSAGPITKE